MTTLHLIATWAVALIGTCALVLLALWLFERALHVLLRTLGWLPHVYEFIQWKRAQNRQEPRTVELPKGPQPNPRRGID